MATTTPKILGSLEREIMQCLWRADHGLSVKEVHADLGARRPLAYTTVMTVMQRLVEKKVLTRRLKGAAYLYQPAAERTQFLRTAIRDFFDALRHDFGDAAEAAFLDEISHERREV